MSDITETYTKTQPKFSQGHYENPWPTWGRLPNLVEFMKWKTTAREEDHPKVILVHHCTIFSCMFEILA